MFEMSILEFMDSLPKVEYSKDEWEEYCRECDYEQQKEYDAFGLADLRAMEGFLKKEYPVENQRKSLLSDFPKGWQDFPQG